MPVGALSRVAAGVVGAGGVLHTGIWDRLEKVPDPRSRRGRVYPLPCLVAVVLCALTAAGHDGVCAVAQWAARTSPAQRARLRLPRHPLTGRFRVPDEATIRRFLAALDSDALVSALLAPDAVGGPRLGPSPDTAPAVWQPVAGQVVGLAVDGKTSRGARRADGSLVHLLGAATHGLGLLVGQVEVDVKSNETTVFRRLLDRLDLAGIVITADAMHTVRANLEWLVTEKKAHHLAVIKANQPRAHARMKALPWADIPVADTTRDSGHGRDETRVLKVATVGHLDFPYAAQALRITRWRREKNRRPSRETVYAITDLTGSQAGPAQLADLARAHWHIENKVHYVRDVSFGEDSSTVRTGNAPANLATIRSAATNALRRAGHTFIPTGRHARTTPTDALTLHGFP